MGSLEEKEILREKCGIFSEIPETIQTKMCKIENGAYDFIGIRHDPRRNIVLLPSIFPKEAEQMITKSYKKRGLIQRLLFKLKFRIGKKKTRRAVRAKYNQNDSIYLQKER